MIVRKILRSLPERFHAKITAIEDSKDLDSIPLTKLIENLQTHELGLVRVSKCSKSKNMALRSKMMIKMNRLKMRTLSSNHTSPDNSRSSLRMQMSRQVTRITNNLDFPCSNPKTKARENSKMLAKAIMFLLGQSTMDVKDMGTWNKNVLRISNPLVRAKP